MRPYTPWWGCSIEFHASFIFWMNSCRRRKYLLSHSRDSCVPHRHQMITPDFSDFLIHPKVGSCYTSTHMISDSQSIGVRLGIRRIMKLIDILDHFNASTHVKQVVSPNFWLTLKMFKILWDYFALAFKINNFKVNRTLQSDEKDIDAHQIHRL